MSSSVFFFSLQGDNDLKLGEFERLDFFVAWVGLPFPLALGFELESINEGKS
jgi:hypothetical protein